MLQKHQLVNERRNSMFKKDEKKPDRLLVTRGDRGSVYATATDLITNTPYVFQSGDKVSFVVVPENGYSEGAVIRKDVIVTEETQEVEIPLTSEDTKIGDMIDEYEDYWYNVVLNDDITIIGSDDTGEKVFRLYPEVGEGNE